MGERGLRSRETNLIYMWTVAQTERLQLGRREREKLTLTRSIYTLHTALHKSAARRYNQPTLRGRYSITLTQNKRL